jgi:hypothetical protein
VRVTETTIKTPQGPRWFQASAAAGAVGNAWKGGRQPTPTAGAAISMCFCAPTIFAHAVYRHRESPADG